jgi:hypothetical protein
VTPESLYAAVDKSTQTEPIVPSLGHLGCAIRHESTGRLILLLPSARELASHPPAGGVKNPDHDDLDIITGLGPVLYRFRVDAHGNPMWDAHGELLRASPRVPFTAETTAASAFTAPPSPAPVKWHTVLPLGPFQHEGMPGWVMQTAGHTVWIANQKIVSIQLVLVRDALQFHDCPHDILAMVAMRNAQDEVVDAQPVNEQQVPGQPSPGS